MKYSNHQTKYTGK